MMTSNNPFNHQALLALGDAELQLITDTYSIGSKGIFKTGFQRFPSPISLGFLTVEMKYIRSDGYLEYDLAYIFEGKIKMLRVTHEDLLPTRLKRLAAKGVPIDHNKVKDLSNALAVISAHLIATPLVNKLGFSEINGEIQFVGPPKKMLLDNEVTSMFDLGPSGEAEKELQNIQDLVIGYPALELSYLLGLAAITTWVLNNRAKIDVFPAFYYHFGESSLGKTTVTLVTLSAFGNPSPRSSRSLVQTYGSTDLSLIQYASYLNGYAMGIDDFGSASNKNKTNFIYAIVNGKVKARATSEGEVIQGDGFSATGVGNGEEGLSDNMSDHVGGQLRVIEFSGLSYTESAEHSEDLKEAFTDTYGHTAQLFADALLNYTVKELKTAYENSIEHLVQSAGLSNLSPMVNRYVKQLAVLMATAGLINDALELSFHLVDIEQLLVENLESVMYRLDNAIHSHEKIVAYVYEHLNAFEVDGVREVQEGSRLGVIKPSKHDAFTRICIPTGIMKRIATELELSDLTPLMKKIKEEGLLESEEKRYTKKVKGIRCYVLLVKDFTL